MLSPNNYDLWDISQYIYLVLDKTEWCQFRKISRLNGVIPSCSDLKYIFPFLVSKTSKNIQLIQESKNSNFYLIKLLVEWGADINYKDDSLYTPLIYACGKSNLNLVKYLVDNGADINHTTTFNVNALNVSIIYGDSDISVIKYLVEHGANVNIHSEYGYTPLFHAINEKNINVVKLLVESGADLNFKYKNGLYESCRCGSLEILQYLLSKGEILDKSCVDIAIIKGHLDIVKYLYTESYFDINYQDDNGWTSLMVSVNNGHLELTKYLLEKGAKIKNKYGKSALVYARSAEFVNILFKYRDKS